MAPTCNSNVRSEEDTTKVNSEGTVSGMAALCLEESNEWDSEPFYGMFDRHTDDLDTDSWAQIRLPASPRGSIPEASETFQRVMRQLDGIEDLAARAASAGKNMNSADSKDSIPADLEKPERKCSHLKKKSASFSAPDCHCSSPCSEDTGTEVRRRKSVPCMQGEKHVQWADEAGVADLVAVRLIRPRLAKGDKDESPVSMPRSILRRLTGIH